MNQDAQQLQSVYRVLRGRFQKAGLDVPELDARLLIQEVCGFSHADFILKHDMLLTSSQLENIQDLAERRLGREPVSRILGYREFFGQIFHLNEDTLDPRADSEILVETAIKFLEQRGKNSVAPKRKDSFFLLDIGTGSGALIIALLDYFPHAQGIATDISEQALRQAGRNAEKLGVADRLKLVCTSWTEGVKGPFDLILSNPPYIPSHVIETLEPEVQSFDPVRALDGGSEGLDAYRALIPQTRHILKQDGCLLLEIGEGQAEAVRETLMENGYVSGQKGYTPLRDLGGIERCILAHPA